MQLRSTKSEQITNENIKRHKSLSEEYKQGLYIQRKTCEKNTEQLSHLKLNLNKINNGKNEKYTKIFLSQKRKRMDKENDNNSQTTNEKKNSPHTNKIKLKNAKSIPIFSF